MCLPGRTFQGAVNLALTPLGLALLNRSNPPKPEVFVDYSLHSCPLTSFVFFYNNWESQQ